jgi:hypothetical protein
MEIQAFPVIESQPEIIPRLAMVASQLGKVPATATTSQTIPSAFKTKRGHINTTI